MKLATIRAPEGTKAVRVEGNTFVGLGVDSVSTLLASGHRQAKGRCESRTVAEVVA